LDAKQAYEQALKEAQSGQASNAEVARLLEFAAERDEPSAKFALGNWFFHGKYFEKPIPRAIDLWSEASALGSIEASLELGILYENGELVKKRLDLAFQYYLLAALAQSGQGLFELSRFFYHGIFVPKSHAIHDLLRDAAEQHGYEDD